MIIYDLTRRVIFLVQLMCCSFSRVKSQSAPIQPGHSAENSTQDSICVGADEFGQSGQLSMFYGPWPFPKDHVQSTEGLT